MLGVGIQPVTAELASSLGLKEARGVLINEVRSGGPAEKAGIKTGDVILQLNGKDVNDPNTLRNEIAAAGPGAEVTLNLLRDGKQQQMKVRLVELTADAARAGGEQGVDTAGDSKLGVTVTPITPEIAQQLGLRRGTQGVAVESVEPDGPAARVGIQSGDVIQEVNRQPVRSAADMRSALQKSGDRPPLLLVNRGGQTQYVPVPLQ
jgi:S1-C subfamily serine protease